MSSTPGNLPPQPPPPPPPTQIAGQESGPYTSVPYTGPMPPPSSINIGGRKLNQLAVVSLVTAIAAPFGHLIGVGGITLIAVSLATGHMARSQIKKTGEDGAAIALIGLVISYIHLVVAAVVVFFFFSLVVAFFALIFHAATGG